MRNRIGREERRGLRRSEIASPKLGGYLGEIQRDAGYMRYRALRLLGPFGRPVGVLVIVAAIAAVIVRALR